MSQFLDNQYAARVMKLLIAPDVSKHDVGFNTFQRVVLEIRDLIESLPGGSLKLRQYAVAHRFILAKLPAVVTEEISDFAKTETYKAEYLKMLEFVIENQLRLVEEEMAVADAIWYLREDGEGGAVPVGAPANSVAGVEPHDQPVIDKKRKRLAAIYKREEPKE
jgi:hypothetical protein